MSHRRSLATIAAIAATGLVVGVGVRLFLPHLVVLGDGQARRQVTFGATPIASADERQVVGASGVTVERATTLSPPGLLGVVTNAGPASHLRATLDHRGWPTRATYERPGQRVVRFDVEGLRGAADVALMSNATPMSTTSTAPVLLLELLHLVRDFPSRALLVELSSTEAMPVHIRRQGAHWRILPAVDGVSRPDDDDDDDDDRDNDNDNNNNNNNNNNNDNDDDDGMHQTAPRPASDALLTLNFEGERLGPGAFAERPQGATASDDDVAGRGAARPTTILTPGRTVAGHLSMARRRNLLALPAPAGPVDDNDIGDGPLLEVHAPEVEAFATPLCRGTPLDTARALIEAVRPLVRADAVDVAPSAVQMLRRGGDCDGAAALVVASLRYCGYAARPLVGYRLLAPGRPEASLAPHAVAAVFDLRLDDAGGDTGAGASEATSSWWIADATVPSLAPLASREARFLPVARGLGGSLSMGQLLGVIDAHDLRGDPLDDDDLAPATPPTTPDPNDDDDDDDDDAPRTPTEAPHVAP